MFPFDPLWAYVGVPVILVSILILIKFRQEKMEKRVERTYTKEVKEETGTHEAAKEKGLNEFEGARRKPQTSGETRPQGCSNYLGYLQKRKAPDRTHIPTECYNCPDLLKCLYSPAVVGKVYGE